MKFMWIAILAGAFSVHGSAVSPCQYNITQGSPDVTAESLVLAGRHDDAQACFKLQLVDILLSDPFDLTLLTNVTLGIVDAFSYAGVPHDIYSGIFCDAVAMALYGAAIPFDAGAEFNVTAVMGVLGSGGFVLNELATVVNLTVLGSALGKAAQDYVVYPYPRYTMVPSGLTFLVFSSQYEDRHTIYEAFVGQLLANASCSATGTTFALAMALQSFDYYGQRIQEGSGSFPVAPITECKAEMPIMVYLNSTSVRVGDIVLV